MYVFISYSGEDQATADGVAACLKRQNIPAYCMSQEGHALGVDILLDITNAMTRATHFVPIVSENYLKRLRETDAPYVLFEVLFARALLAGNRIKVLPFVSQAALPGALQERLLGTFTQLRALRSLPAGREWPQAELLVETVAADRVSRRSPVLVATGMAFLFSLLLFWAPRASTLWTTTERVCIRHVFLQDAKQLRMFMDGEPGFDDAIKDPDECQADSRRVRVSSTLADRLLLREPMVNIEGLEKGEPDLCSGRPEKVPSILACANTEVESCFVLNCRTADGALEIRWCEDEWGRSTCRAGRIQYVRACLDAKEGGRALVMFARRGTASARSPEETGP